MRVRVPGGGAQGIIPIRVPSPNGWGQSSYYAAGEPTTFGASVFAALTELRAVPFATRRAGIVDRFGYEVTVGGAAGAVANFGIYDSSPVTGYPTALLFDSGAQDMTVVGVAQLVIPATLVLANDRLYWLAYNPRTAGPATIRTGTLQAQQILGLNPTNPGVNFGGYSSHIFGINAAGVLPNPFPAGANEGGVVMPILAVRYSSIN